MLNNLMVIFLIVKGEQINPKFNAVKKINLEIFQYVQIPIEEIQLRYLKTQFPQIFEIKDLNFFNKGIFNQFLKNVANFEIKPDTQNLE